MLKPLSRGTLEDLLNQARLDLEDAEFGLWLLAHRRERLKNLLIVIGASLETTRQNPC